MEILKGNKDPTPDNYKFSFVPNVLVMLVSIVVVIAAVFYVRGWEKEKLLKDFHFSANTYRQLLEGRLRDIVIELDSAKRFFQGSTFVDRKEFASFITPPISKSPEIRAVSWAPRITSSQRQTIEASAWIRGLDGRKIHDTDPLSMDDHDKPSPSRTIHFPILYSEPAEKMAKLISFDLASRPTILAQLEQARDEGIIVPITRLSSPHLLVDGIAKRKSNVSLIQAVYQTATSAQTIKQRRDKHLGFLILQYDIGLALEEALSSLEPSGLDIYIVDVEAEDAQEIVYHHRSRLSAGEKPLTYRELWKLPEFIHKSALNVSGRQWKMMMVPLPLYFKNHQQYQSWGVLVFGLILSALLSYMAFVNQRRTDVIRKTVKFKTKELSIANEALHLEAKERRAHLKELEFQEYAIDQHAIVSITDVKGTITYANDKFCQISGYSRDELVGQNHRILLSAGHPTDFFEDMWRTIASGKVWQGDIKNKNKNAGNYWVRTTIVPNLNEEKKPFEYLAIRTEITENINLETDLQIAKEDADKANKAKSEFLSSMSHELRTPMNAILGFAQMLEFNPMEPLTKTQKGSVDHIMKGGQHLLELINEVLDLAKIEAGKMDISYADVSARTVLDECLALVHAMAEENGIEIIVAEGFETTVEIHTDQTRFRQSLLNLMSNAVKYNCKNGLITIDCYATPGAMLHISVTDTGDGISEDMLGELFQPFSRLKAEKSEIEGTGIGLTITKQLIESMDGHIGVDSEIGRGSTFWIELPLSERKLIDEHESFMQEAEGGSKLLPNINGTILYVEDNPANLKLMEMIIERVEGLSMIAAHNAELGIELAKSNNPDIIILDINLPGMDGFAALKTLQSLVKTTDIPVIALSANAMPKDIEKGIEAGFKYYLTKPIKVEEVVNAIKAIIEK